MVERYRQSETEKKKECRNCYELKQKECEVQTKSKRKARSYPYNLEQERVAKQQWRLDKSNGKDESILDCKWKSSKHKERFFCQAENFSAKRRKYGGDIDDCIKLFHDGVYVGPVYICTCYHQTWFRQSVCEAKCLHSEQNEKYLIHIISVDKKEWLCISCKKWVEKFLNCQFLWNEMAKTA